MNGFVDDIPKIELPDGQSTKIARAKRKLRTKY